MTRSRELGSPAWLPTFRNGSVVRFMNQYQGLEMPYGEWGDFRIAFLQYGSDPITFFEPGRSSGNRSGCRSPGHRTSRRSCAGIRW
ncbi:alpha/beta-hydrolase family protein [Halomonas sp. BC04]|uniref:alpha/beta-hydrolase family protein n=1 Tax=Halomonas sp. BC04 TaxID=1403540 RepID=UPI0004B70B63|nr:alpha/beta-hydrolase family protein [Halomonas sp. BC04]